VDSDIGLPRDWKQQVEMRLATIEHEYVRIARFRRAYRHPDLVFADAYLCPVRHAVNQSRDIMCGVTAGKYPVDEVTRFKSLRSDHRLFRFGWRLGSIAIQQEHCPHGAESDHHAKHRQCNLQISPSRP